MIEALCVIIGFILIMYGTCGVCHYTYELFNRYREIKTYEINYPTIKDLDKQRNALKLELYRVTLERDELKNKIRAVKNSIAIGFWNINPEIRATAEQIKNLFEKE
jgi:hypothetical protein